MPKEGKKQNVGERIIAEEGYQPVQKGYQPIHMLDTSNPPGGISGTPDSKSADSGADNTESSEKSDD